MEEEFLVVISTQDEAEFFDEGVYDALFDGDGESMIGSLIIPSSVVGVGFATSITAGIATVIVMRTATATAAATVDTSWIATMATAPTSRSCKMTIHSHLPNATLSAPALAVAASYCC